MANKRLTDAERVARKLSRSDRATQRTIKQEYADELKSVAINLKKLASFKDFADNYTSFGKRSKPRLLKENTGRVLTTGEWDKEVTARTAKQYQKLYSDYLNGYYKHGSPGRTPFKKSNTANLYAYDAFNKRPDNFREKLAEVKREEAWDRYEQDQAWRAKKQQERAKATQHAYEYKQHAAEQKRLNQVFGYQQTPAIFAGVSPWDKRYGEFRKLNKRQMTAISANPKAIKSPDKKTIHLADGTTATVIDSHLGVPLGFSQMFGYNGPADTAAEVINKKEMTSLEYAERAFDGKHKTKQHDGCGHITHIEYSAYFQLLKVTFARGDVVVYYRVPSTVAGELLHFAETKQTSTNTFDGSERHVLGIRFWDLVRIRGTKHGSRYRFEYLEQVAGSGNSPTGRPVFEPPEDLEKDTNGAIIMDKPVKQQVYDTKEQIATDWKKRTRAENKELERYIIEEAEALKSQQVTTADEIEDKVDSYFTDGEFNNDIGKASGALRQKLQSLYDKWSTGVASYDSIYKQLSAIANRLYGD